MSQITRLADRGSLTVLLLADRGVECRSIEHFASAHTLRAKVLTDTKTATGWVYSVIQQITQEAVPG